MKELCTYNINDQIELYDYSAMMKITGCMNKTKIHRVLAQYKITPSRIYKNIYLFNEESLFIVMEEILIKQLKKLYKKHSIEIN